MKFSCLRAQVLVNKNNNKKGDPLHYQTSSKDWLFFFFFPFSYFCVSSKQDER